MTHDSARRILPSQLPALQGSAEISGGPLAYIATKVATRLAASGLPLTTAPLEPEHLDAATWSEAISMVEAGTPLNTKRSYASAAQYIAAWYLLRFGQNISLPIPQAAAIRFVLDHLPSRDRAGGFLPPSLPADINAALVSSGCKASPGPLAMATVNHRISFLSRVHKSSRLPSPTDSPEVQTLLRAARAVAVRAPGAAPKKAAALTRDDMQTILDKCDHSLTGKRDRALLLFGWCTGGRRRSEIASANMRNLIRCGMNSYDYILLLTKTNQLGEISPDAHKPLRGAAADAMSSWLSASGITEGPIFRNITSDGQVGAPLTEPSVSKIVTRRATAAGLKGHFTAHSLRSGFVTQSHLDGVPAPEAMAMTGHTSLSVYNSYFRSDPSRDHRSANLIDAPSKSDG
jgi:integrase